MKIVIDDHEKLTQRFLSGELVEQLRQFGVLSQEQAEAVGLALADIAEEIAGIYGKILPRLERATTPDEFRDALIELVLAIRHIDYHIHDGKLTEL